MGSKGSVEFSSDSSVDFRAKFELFLVLQTGEFDHWGPGPIPLATSRLYCKDINHGFCLLQSHHGQCPPRSVFISVNESISVSVHFCQCPPRSMFTSVSQCPSRSVFTSISVHLGQCLSRSVSVRLGQCSPRSVSVHFSRLVKVSQRAVCGSACFVLSCGLFFEWRGLYLGALRGLV